MKQSAFEPLFIFQLLTTIAVVFPDFQQSQASPCRSNMTMAALDLENSNVWYNYARLQAQKKKKKFPFGLTGNGNSRPEPTKVSREMLKKLDLP